MIDKRIDSVELEDLQALVEDSVSEGRSLEFKLVLPGDAPSQRKEFLADVSSFANAAGGFLVIGIDEKRGVAANLVGVELDDVDAALLRLENMARDGINPRIPGLRIRALALGESKHAFLIWVPRSWAMPHMVSFKGHGKFYSRNSAGKYPLDAVEIRSLFSLSDSASRRLESFRAERLAAISEGHTPVPLEEGARLVLHLMPLSAAHAGAPQYDVMMFRNDLGSLRPLYASGWNHRVNLEGLVTFSQPNKKVPAGTYLQLFRDGTLEACDTGILERMDNTHKTVIPSITFERKLIGALPRFLDLLGRLGVEPPIAVMLSLLSVKGYTMGVSELWRGPTYGGIDRDDLVLPEIMLESTDIEADRVLKPLFDMIWNAAGWPGSIYYNDEGKWEAPR